jgi:hypothetical protein
MAEVVDLWTPTVEAAFQSEIKSISGIVWEEVVEKKNILLTHGPVRSTGGIHDNVALCRASHRQIDPVFGNGKRACYSPFSFADRCLFFACLALVYPLERAAGERAPKNMEPQGW